MSGDTLARLGMQMRKARKARGFTQEQLADRSGVSVRHIAKIEKGEINPSFEVLSALAAALGRSFDAIFWSTNEGDEAALQELIGLYRICPPEGRRLLLAVVRTLVNELTGQEQEQEQTPEP